MLLESFFPWQWDNPSWPPFSSAELPGRAQRAETSEDPQSSVRFHPQQQQQLRGELKSQCPVQPQKEVPAVICIPVASENNSATRNRISGDNLLIRRKALATEMSNEPIKESHCRGTHLALTSENLHGSQAFTSRINKHLFISSVLGSRRTSWLVCLLKYYWHFIL